MDVNLKPTNLKLRYTCQVFIPYLFVPIKPDSMVTLLRLFVVKDNSWAICHRYRQPVLEVQKHSGPVAGLQFID